MPLSTVPTSTTTPQVVMATCPLANCAPGSQATVVGLGCSPDEGCRLRALGLYEGSQVCVVEARHCMLVDVRGTRLALGNDLTAGITVQLERRSA